MEVAYLRKTISEYSKKLCGSNDPEVICLGGHASYRIYHRVKANNKSFIIMELSKDISGSEEISKATVSEKLPFIEMQEFLKKHNIKVPEIYSYLQEDGLILLEDLGEQTFENIILEANKSEIEKHYKYALDDLSIFQKIPINTDNVICFKRQFDYDLLKWELDHFTEWFLVNYKGITLNDSESKLIEKCFSYISTELTNVPKVLVHRDYQSRNIMVQDSPFRLRLIDFQDALVGPVPYDLVALLRDSYIELDVELVNKLLVYFLKNSPVSMPHDSFMRSFWLQTIQRKLKDSGRFIFIDRVKKNPSFLKHILLSLKYVQHALAQLPELKELQDLLGSFISELSA